METKANYIVTGVFTLAVIVGAFGFIFWFQNTGGGGDRTDYRVVFDGSVSGLRTGASVNFNGIRVGEVAQLALDAHDPRKVVALLKLDRGVPVRADTKVGLNFQGLTGLAEVSLTGGSADAAVLVSEAGQPPTIHADPSASGDVTQQARDVLSRIDGLVAENETTLRASLQQYRDGDLDAGAEFRAPRQGDAGPAKPHRRHRRQRPDRPGRRRDPPARRRPRQAYG